MGVGKGCLFSVTINKIIWWGKYLVYLQEKLNAYYSGGKFGFGDFCTYLELEDFNLQPI